MRRAFCEQAMSMLRNVDSGGSVTNATFTYIYIICSVVYIYIYLCWELDEVRASRVSYPPQLLPCSLQLVTVYRRSFELYYSKVHWLYDGGYPSYILLIL
jgi:hypothetical protein